jgi:hypothetical protein
MAVLVRPIALTAAEDHRQSEWKGTCAVDLAKPPCRTARYREYSFGSSFGFDGITNAESIEAVNHRGSEARMTTALAAEHHGTCRGSEYWEQDDLQCFHARSHYL